MASFVLLIWPFVALAIFARFGRERGLIWTVVGGYLFLPEATSFALPGIPDYEKLSAIAVAAVLGAIVFRDKLTWPDELAIAPPGEMASKLAGVWGELLDRDPHEIPRDVSFRDLGGDNRMARVAVRKMVEQGLGRIKAWGIYKGQTIDELSWRAPKAGPQKLGTHSLAVIFYGMLIVFCLAAVATWRDNDVALVNDWRVRSGLSFRDVISMISEPLIEMVPFFAAVALLRTRRHHEEVLRAIAILGAFYAGLALVEARFSPQMNIWVYGYFQHSWVQHLRGGGFRPIVFLRHGLWLGFFLLTVVIAAFALYRQYRTRERWYFLGIGVWTLAVLMVSRNLGAAMLVIAFLPVLMIVPRFFQTRIIALVAILFLAYPAVRQAEVLPIDSLTNFVGENISAQRASSLQFRLDNETDMMLRALEKPFFGWGGWGRWRVIDDLGRDTTVSDGIWIIILGERGWVGYICFFGLLTLPMIYLVRVARKKEVTPVIIAMGLIMAANLIYMIPNSTLSPIGWLLAGTMAAFIRWHPKEVATPEEEDVRLRRFVPYTRFEQTHTRGISGPTPVMRSD